MYIARVRGALGYVASTDGDVVARVVAREAREGLEQPSSTLQGLEDSNDRTFHLADVSCDLLSQFPWEN